MIQVKLEPSLAVNAEQVFSSLALLSLITRPTLSLLATIPLTAASLGCFERIQAFLLLPVCRDQRVISEAHAIIGTPSNAPQKNPTRAATTKIVSDRSGSDDPSTAVKISNLSLSVGSGERLLMRDLDLDISKGSFITVTGPVGCGKTSLLKAIVGDLAYERGRVTASQACTAYCSQKVWLANGSLRQAICGPSTHTTIDEVWYRRVLRACALDFDIANMDAGDATVIGSRGATLSGGQKQRIVGLLNRLCWCRPANHCDRRH